MFIENATDTLFEVMNKWDNSCEPEQRWKELRSGVNAYNILNGTSHEFNSYTLNLYWHWLKTQGRLITPNYQYK